MAASVSLSSILRSPREQEHVQESDRRLLERYRIQRIVPQNTLADIRGDRRWQADHRRPSAGKRCHPCPVAEIVHDHAYPSRAPDTLWRPGLVALQTSDDPFLLHV